MNPFYNLQQMPINSNPFGGGPFGNMMNMMQQFNQFKSTFQGDPQQKVQELLSSGKMTQQQFNQLSQMAQQFKIFMGNKY